MTAPLLANRAALAKALFGINEPIGESWGDRFDPAQREVYLSMADALLASGVVRDPATLAADEALVIRTMQGSLCQLRKHQVQSALRALDAALTEDPSREGCAVIADGSKRTLTPLACKGSISGVTEAPS